MSGSKHTPGPWVARLSGDPDVLTAAGDIICGVYTDENAEDDARLIAAAPDLKMAGKHLAVKLAEVYRAAGRKPSDCQAIRDWMAAISKAEA